MAKASDSLKLSAETGPLLEQTLAAAAKAATSEGKSPDGLIEGSNFREVPTHVNERGSVVELFAPRWQWRADALRRSECTWIDSLLMRRKRTASCSHDDQVLDADQRHAAMVDCCGHLQHDVGLALDEQCGPAIGFG